MDLLHIQDAKEIFETTNDEISDEEAMQIIADWSIVVTSSPLLSGTLWSDKTKTKSILISATKWNILKRLDQVFIWIH